jgi:hypothetical protein
MNGTPGYVEVTDEPMHKEIFRNENFRIYVALIPPGEPTLYHRHSEDTLYIVFDGGLIKNENYKGCNNYSIVFPKTFGKFKLIKMGVQKAFFGFVDFFDGSFFLMPNKTNPVIHKATASKKNLKNMQLMGIEIYQNRAVPKQTPIIAGKKARKEFETDNCSVFSLSLKYNQYYGIDKSARFCCLVCMKGTSNIESVKFGNTKEKTINKNEFYVQDSPGKLVVRNFQKDSMKTLVILTV